MLTGPTLLAEIESFLVEHQLYSESYFGILAVHDGKLVARLRAGRTVTLETAVQIMDFIREEKRAPGIHARRASLARVEKRESAS